MILIDTKLPSMYYFVNTFEVVAFVFEPKPGFTFPKMLENNISTLHKLADMNLFLAKHNSQRNRSAIYTFDEKNFKYVLR